MCNFDFEVKDHVDVGEGINTNSKYTRVVNIMYACSKYNVRV